MEKIKRFIQSEKGKDILIVFIIILVGLGSFGLGRLSKNQNASGIKIEYKGQEIIPKTQASNVILSMEEASKTSFDISGKTFFGSNRGSKYYSLGCSGGKTIKQENRIYFTTKEEAESAGYELSSSCK